MTSTGGMPSSHSAAVTSLITALGLEYGFASPLVAIATTFGVIVMFDAMAVRRQSGEQGILLSQLFEEQLRDESTKLSEIEIDDDAALTWMRQAHYYMGLYSYTYSAGLVISTAGYLHLKNSETGAEDWLNLLKSGGSKTPLESAMIIGADISTDKPLRDTIQFLSDTVDQIIAYSIQLGE